MNEWIYFIFKFFWISSTPWRGRKRGRESSRWEINFCEWGMIQRLPYLQPNWRNVPAIIIFFLCSCIWWVLTHSVQMLRTERTNMWICHKKKYQFYFKGISDVVRLVDMLHHNSIPISLNGHWAHPPEIFHFPIKFQGVNSVIVCISIQNDIASGFSSNADDQVICRKRYGIFEMKTFHNNKDEFVCNPDNGMRTPPAIKTNQKWKIVLE